ncbi:TPA: hypothetical protein I8Y21_004684 [Klebsiella oxytoca]|uniref:Uncharacterized protein n=1 Tax=Klebsiella oxytoca TaxID=571 RepID=A0AAN5LBI0_KLEOX|nr:hypothetical protein [Klebsiella oxytoca]
MFSFEFLSITFSWMMVQGKAVDIDAVTGNMNEKHRKGFLEPTFRT